MIRLPSLDQGGRYQSCCGKVICTGCFFANAKRDDNKHKQLCAFCRIPAPTSGEEAVERLNKRVDDFRDAEAMFNLGVYYAYGEYNLTQNYNKAFEFWHRAAELGHAAAINNIGNAYDIGRGVEMDLKKAKHYYELAAMGSINEARYNIGLDEEDAGNMDRALRHWMIAAKNGDNNSLKEIQAWFKRGYATKEDYTAALQGYQAYLGRLRVLRGMKLLHMKKISSTIRSMCNALVLVHLFVMLIFERG